MTASNQELVLIIDFGSQYNQLIARRIREHNVYCEFVSCEISAAEIKARAPVGIVLTGGPASVYAPGAPTIDPDILHLAVPVLGICYGMQLGCKLLGADVRPVAARQYGRTGMKVLDHADLFHDLPDEFTTWMSHGDQVSELPDTFTPIATTATCPFAAARHASGTFFGVQFHPEVTHTAFGSDILRNFLYRVCGASGAWTSALFIQETVARLKEQIGGDGIICGLSGGVDSSVVAALIDRAVGEQLTCIFVDNGVLRRDEAKRVVDRFDACFKGALKAVDASDLFLDRLKGVTDPEEKRKRIGHTFIEVFEAEARKIEGVKYLAQGTLYPDVIESISAKGGPSAVIKSHHNVGGLPEQLGLELVEPVRDLFKDEVRLIGAELGLPREMIERQPFPGPGLAVRILGEVTRERVATLQDADAIVIDEIRAAGFYEKVWQSFAVLLPVQSVGVMGDERTYEDALVLRCVESADGMTADWVRLPYDLLARISNRIINEVKGVNRVVYDISSKPPSTIEWE